MNLIKKHSNFSPFVFDDFFRNTWDILPTNKTVSPATNIIENDKEFILEFSIPGKDNLDFEVELDNRILSLSLKKSDSVSHDNYMLQQFNFSSFNKSLHQASRVAPVVTTSSIKRICVFSNSAVFVILKLVMRFLNLSTLFLKV